MNCERCGSNVATVRYGEVVDGSLTTLHLCEECAAERGVAGSLTSVAGPLVNILMGLLEGSSGSDPSGAGPTCPKCGLVYNEFRKVGRLGCGTCYETFGSQLLPLLRSIHGSAEHSGSVPSDIAGDHLRLREIAKLKVELTHAVQLEDYERAAEIRDVVRSKERELGSAETADVDTRDNDQ